MAKYPEEDLINDFIRGDPKAFKEIYDLYFNRVFVFASQLTGSKEESEDIVLDTFTKLFKIHHRFENIPNIRAFLYVSTRNACLNYLKYRQHLESRKKEWLISLETDASLEINQIEGELLKVIYAEVEKLPARSREILKMYLEGRKVEEISASLHITTATVRSQKRHAIQMLKAALLNSRILTLISLLPVLSTY